MRSGPATDPSPGLLLARRAVYGVAPRLPARTLQCAL